MAEIDNIDSEQVEELQECFALFDKNNTGTMSVKHLGMAFTALGINLTETELGDVEESMDVKGGKIDFNSFCIAAAQKLADVDQFQALKNAFAVFDPDGEGVVTVDRFKRWMTNLGQPLNDAELKEIVKLGDPPGKGVIVYEDLIALLTND